MQKRKKKWTKKRPPAVTIVAWGIVLLFLIHVYQVAVPLLRHRVFQEGFSKPIFMNGQLTLFGNELISSSEYFFLALAGIYVLIGFLRQRRWSWVVLMGWTGISLTITLIDYFYGEPNYLVLASDTIIAFALNQADVQRIFGIRMDEGEHLG
jgi:ABC-type multidrug transport system fused ATPase/permease subunit